MENDSNFAMVEVGVRYAENIQLGFDDMNLETLEQIWRDIADQKIVARAVVVGQ